MSLAGLWLGQGDAVDGWGAVALPGDGARALADLGLGPAGSLTLTRTVVVPLPRWRKAWLVWEGRSADAVILNGQLLEGGARRAATPLCPGANTIVVRTPLEPDGTCPLGSMYLELE